MKEVWTIIKREYRESVYKKSFIILTLLTPLLMIAIGILPSIFLDFEEEKPIHVNIIDESTFVFNKMVNVLTDTLEDGLKKYVIKLVSVPTNLDSIIRNQRILID